MILYQSKLEVILLVVLILTSINFMKSFIVIVFYIYVLYFKIINDIEIKASNFHEIGFIC